MACFNLSMATCLHVNSHFRDEFLNMEIFGRVLEAKVLGEEHRYKSNHQRPHSSLGSLTPAELASRGPSAHRSLLRWLRAQDSNHKRNFIWKIAVFNS